jgi:SOS-response transcriptional repressor LexA
MDGGDNEAVFKLMHVGQNTLLFQAENPTLAEK